MFRAWSTFALASLQCRGVIKLTDLQSLMEKKELWKIKKRDEKANIIISKNVLARVDASGEKNEDRAAVQVILFELSES